MTSTGILLLLIGLFVIINAMNFVGVLQGNKDISSAVSTQAPTPTYEEPNEPKPSKGKF